MLYFSPNGRDVRDHHTPSQTTCHGPSVERWVTGVGIAGPWIGLGLGQVFSVLLVLLVIFMPGDR